MAVPCHRVVPRSSGPQMMCGLVGNAVVSSCVAAERVFVSVATQPTLTQAAEPPVLSPSLTLLLAAACGIVVANLYYAQPLIGPIGAALGLSSGEAGLIVTATQVGYVLGLLLIVPLADLVENRKLVLSGIVLGTGALLMAGLSTHAGVFLAASCLIGIGSVVVQVIVPYVAHLTPEWMRGRVVGNVMAGLMLGIMLARPAASFLTAAFGWQAVFFVSAGVMVVLGLVLRAAMPMRAPEPGLRYGTLLRSMATLLRSTPVLQRRAAYHFFMFAAFSLFWTVSPLVLAETFHLRQTGIALFALAGTAGAVAAPIAGRLADRGLTRPATGCAMALAAGSFLLWHVGSPGSVLALTALVAAGIAVDFGVQAHLVLAQRAIYSLGAEFRGRLNGLFMAIFFLGGAAGSAVGGWAYERGGWQAASLAGLVLPVIALLMYATEFRRNK